MKEAHKYRTNKLLRQEAICIATALAISVCIANLFKTTHSYWITLTVALMFGIPAHGMIVKKSLHRFIGTIAGLLFCFFFTQTFLFSDYRWINIAPFAMLMLCYLLLLPTGEYPFAVFFITLFVMLTDIILAKPSISIDLVFLKRFEFTVIGLLIALLCEFIIFKNAALTFRNFKINSQNHFAAIGDIITISTDCFIGRKRVTRKLILKLKSWLSTKLSIEDLYIYLRHEFEYEDNKNKMLEQAFKKLNRINESLRKIICIINNDSFSQSGITKREFTEICELVSDKYTLMTRFYYGKTPKKISGFSKILDKVKHHNRMSPTYFYLEEIFELNEQLNEYMEIFKSKNRSS